MKEYKTIHLIKSEDLNVHGTLFAARAASWFVESGFIAAACDYGNPKEIVCINVHGMIFSKPVHNGEIVNFTSRVVRLGTSSITVAIEVTAEIAGDSILTGFATFVTVDSFGKKKPHKLRIDATNDEKELKLRGLANQLFLTN